MSGGTSRREFMARTLGGVAAASPARRKRHPQPKGVFMPFYRGGAHMPCDLQFGLKS
jgi:hypothetical protein